MDTDDLTTLECIPKLKCFFLSKYDKIGKIKINYCNCVLFPGSTISRLFIKRLQPACLPAFEMYTIWDILCMHIINTCAVWQRCESESFSTKWSASRERNKEICSCQGSVRQRLLLEIFGKNHTFEGLVLCCLRISSSDQWNQKKKENMGWRIVMLEWTSAFWKAGDEPFTWFFRGRGRAQVFCSYIKTCITQLKQQCL